MMPNVMDIAREYELTQNPKTSDEKEAMFKCPFCKEDASKKGKYYLSLNEVKNVFKCWYCSEYGGAIALEAKITGEPFNKVKARRMGEKAKSQQKAFALSPEQLKEIGWHKTKRNDYNSFAANHKRVWKYWKSYEYEQMVKYHAMFLLIGYYPYDEKLKERYQEWFLEQNEKSKISSVKKKIMSRTGKEDWAIGGKSVARRVYKATHASRQPENLFVNVLVMIEMLKYKADSQSASV